MTVRLAKCSDQHEFVLAGQLHYGAAMTRFDRTWEPLAVALAFAIVWLGTLL